MVNMSNNRHVTNVVLFVHDPTDLKRTGDIIKRLHIFRSPINIVL